MQATRRLGWLISLMLVAGFVFTACQPAGDEPIVEGAAPEEAEEVAPVEEEEPGEPKSVTMTYFEEPDTMNWMYSGMWYADITFDLFNVPMWFLMTNWRWCQKSQQRSRRWRTVGSRKMASKSPSSFAQRWCGLTAPR